MRTARYNRDPKEAKDSHAPDCITGLADSFIIAPRKRKKGRAFLIARPLPGYHTVATPPVANCRPASVSDWFLSHVLLQNQNGETSAGSKPLSIARTTAPMKADTSQSRFTAELLRTL